MAEIHTDIWITYEYLKAECKAKWLTEFMKNLVYSFLKTMSVLYILQNVIISQVNWDNKEEILCILVLNCEILKCSRIFHATNIQL